MTTTDPTEIACELNPADMSRQRQGWHALAERALPSRTATESGVRLEFDAERDTIHALLDLVRMERACCGWACWTLTSTAEATTVDVTAPGDGAAAVRTMFEVAP